MLKDGKRTGTLLNAVDTGLRMLTTNGWITGLSCHWTNLTCKFWVQAGCRSLEPCLILGCIWHSFARGKDSKQVRLFRLSGVTVPCSASLDTSRWTDSPRLQGAMMSGTVWYTLNTALLCYGSQQKLKGIYPITIQAIDLNLQNSVKY